MSFELKEALRYLVSLGEEQAKPETIEICGRTYANKGLIRYGEEKKAEPLKAHTLSAMIEYIQNCYEEFKTPMLINIEDPKRVTLLSWLSALERERECLFQSEAVVSEFRFDTWYDQERFLIELQANFCDGQDMEILRKVAGNVESGTTANYGDDGVSQKTTIKSGIATREDVIVPNPCVLIPYRTFQEVGQPASQFVFRISEDGEPMFKLVEADNQIWKLQAIKNIKEYFKKELKEMSEEISSKITIIG